MKYGTDTKVKTLVIKLCLIGLLSINLLFHGCATVVRGGSETIAIQTDPPGAEVKLSTGQYGVTPFEAEIKRKGTVFVTITKEGYKEVSTALISSIDGASLGVGTTANLIFLPIVNDIVDYNTGANYSHKPNPLIVKLISIDSNEEYKFVNPEEEKQQPEAEVTDSNADKESDQSIDQN